MTKIIMAGATGLVGGELLKLFGRSTHEVHIIGRRKAADVPKSINQHVAPNQEWPVIVEGIGADVAISCLGTTMKVAGSKEAFAAVDLHLATAFATAAKAGGARHMLAVSSAMAVSSSSNFYLKTKGQAEDALAALGFDRADFLRPGLLRGERGGPYRSGEAIGMLISPLIDLMLIGSLRKYRSIAARDVARAMANLIDATGQGRFIHENDAILSLAS